MTFLIGDSPLGNGTVLKNGVCDKCGKGYISMVRWDMDMVYCSNALCDENYVKSCFLGFRKREVNKK